MNRKISRRQFIGIAGTTLAAIGTTGYLLSDKHSVERNDIAPEDVARDDRNVDRNGVLQPHENAILSLASLAPSGHNTQPWFVQRLEAWHWIIGNDQTKWLPAVDPTQRETMLSLGAFAQNLELAAAHFGYVCDWKLLARTNQDDRVLEVNLFSKTTPTFDIETIKTRRSVRSHFESEVLQKADVKSLINSQAEFVHYLPATSRESQWLDTQTVEANRLQAYRDAAQRELADWIRFSSADAIKHRDGLTTASMEIEGAAGWAVRNFYGKANVMKTDFREKNIEKVRQEVAQSAGWIVIASKDESVASLLETGRRLQRLWLQVREKSIAIHPMTQILEEDSTHRVLDRTLGIGAPIQFLLRVGYVKNYPAPVSLRRPVGWFVRT